MLNWPWLRPLKLRLRRFRQLSVDVGLQHSISLLLVAIAVAGIWFLFFPALGNDYRVEFVGLIFDIVFILVIFSLFQFRAVRRQDIARQSEVIEDYKRWDSEEARFRIAGAIRRLNRMGVTKLDLTGIRLSNFVFGHHGIRDISGTIFYDGSWGELFRKNDVQLQNVSFDGVRCRSVSFSPFNPLRGLVGNAFEFAKLFDCSFIRADLTNASFNGAHLKWSEPPPQSLYEEYGEDDYGNPLASQVVYGPFDGTDLSGTSFQNTHFENADFRNAINIDNAKFDGATGLDSCTFSEEAYANDVLRELLRKK